MNTALILVMAVLIVIAIMHGIVWLAMGLLGLLLILSIAGDNRAAQKPFFYREKEMPPVSAGIPEQMLRVKFQDQWSGHEDDQEYANLVAENWGSGLGRGFGFFR